MSQGKCLEGVRVLELARVLAAPLAGQALGDLGAEVIKVERPVTGDENRWSGTRIDTASAPGAAPYSSGYIAANRNKKSITVEFSHAEGRELILALAERSDILIENFLPGTLSRYGLGYEQVSATNPRIIYCSLTGYGQSGPQARQPGYDAVFQATSGMMDISGLPDGEPGGGPMKVGFQIADFASGTYLAMAALAALHERQRSGVGQHIDVALADVAMAAMAMKAQEHLVTGQRQHRQGNLHLTNRWLSTVLYCSDRPILVTCNTDEQFAKFCRTFGCAEILADERYNAAVKRKENIATLLPLMQSVAAARAAQSMLADCRDAQIPAAPVNDFEGAFAEPQARHRGTAVTLPNPYTNDLRVIANPIKLSRTPVDYAAPPQLGEHNDEVLQGLLGMSPQQLTALKSRGVI